MRQYSDGMSCMSVRMVLCLHACLFVSLVHCTIVECAVVA